MGRCAFWVLAGLLAAGSAHASERIDLTFPGWALYLDLRSPPYEARVPGEPPLRHSLVLRVPGKSLFAESGLRVDSRDAIRAGGDRGPAVVPGDPQASWLITAVSHADPVS